jgi:hypothetical protein
MDDAKPDAVNPSSEDERQRLSERLHNAFIALDDASKRRDWAALTVATDELEAIDRALGTWAFHRAADLLDDYRASRPTPSDPPNG